MEHFADFDAPTQQLFPGSLNVGDGQVQALGGARRRRRDVLAKNYRTAGAGRRELNSTPLVSIGEIGVEPPPELGVELFRAVYIRNGMITTSTFISTLTALASVAGSLLLIAFKVAICPPYAFT